MNHLDEIGRRINWRIHFHKKIFSVCLAQMQTNNESKLNIIETKKVKNNTFPRNFASPVRHIIKNDDLLTVGAFSSKLFNGNKHACRREQQRKTSNLLHRLEPQAHHSRGLSSDSQRLNRARSRIT